MGVLYGKLGLATDPTLIERRAEGAKAAADALKNEGIPELIRCLLGTNNPQTLPAFLNAFNDADPTFDVAADDKEASLLASTVAALKMESKSNVGAKLALIIVTASVGGMRPPAIDDQLFDVAEESLVASQKRTITAPANRTYNAQSAELTAAIDGVKQVGAPQNFAQTGGHYLTAIDLLGQYVEATAKAAAVGDNVVLGYIRQLEEELRTYWWVVGGWSSDAGKAFRSFTPIEAAVRAGKELASKSSLEFGLFAAPAMIDIVVERGRRGIGKDQALSEAAKGPNRQWRTETFDSIANGPFADLLPVSTMLALAAASEDANDWHPRFKRITGLDLSQEISALDLGIQVYRERLAHRVLSGQS